MNDLKHNGDLKAKESTEQTNTNNDINWTNRLLQCLVLAVLTFEVVYGSYVSPVLRQLFTLMKLFRIFKKKPHLHGHASGQTSANVPTASAVPAASSTPINPFGAEILVQGVDPITAE